MPTPEEVIAYCDRRIAAVTSCKARIEAVLAKQPDHPEAAGLKRRLAEYADSLEGLPLIRAKAVLDLKQKTARQKRPGDHEITPRAVGR